MAHELLARNVFFVPLHSSSVFFGQSVPSYHSPSHCSSFQHSKLRERSIEQKRIFIQNTFYYNLRIRRFHLLLRLHQAPLELRPARRSHNRRTPRHFLGHLQNSTQSYIRFSATFLCTTRVSSGRRKLSTSMSVKRAETSTKTLQFWLGGSPEMRRGSSA